MKTEMKSTKKADFLLLAAVISLCACLLSGWLLSEKPGDTVTVTVSGQVFGTYQLAEDAVISIGGHNTLVIQDGQAMMEWADCTNQVCVRHAAISKAGQMIVCLPNQVIVTVNGTSGADAVTQ